MSHFDVSLYERDGSWYAAIPRLLVAAEGPTPESAAAAAVKKAKAAELELIAAGLARPGKGGSISLAPRVWPTIRATLVDFGTKAVTLGLLFIAIFLVVRGDIKSEIAKFRNVVADEVSLLHQLLDGSALQDPARLERLRQRAKTANDLLLPVAEELRPLFRALTSDGQASGGGVRQGNGQKCD